MTGVGHDLVRQRAVGAQRPVGLVDAGRVEQNVRQRGRVGVGAADRLEVDLRLAREVVAVRVDHRHDDRAHAVHQVRDARVLAVALDQVGGELHRHLGRGPLARVVHAHLEEDGLAVGGVHVLRDLDAVDQPALEACGWASRSAWPGRDARAPGPSCRPRSRPGGGSRRGRWAARTSSSWRGSGRWPGGCGSSAGRGRRPRSLGEARAAQLGGVGGAVEHHVDVALVAVLGHVEAEAREAGLGGARRRSAPRRAR